MKLKRFQMCGNNTAYISSYIQKNVNSYGGRESCTCTGFRFNHRCKHLIRAREIVCSYHEKIHGLPLKKGKCPHCGAKTIIVRCSV